MLVSIIVIALAGATFSEFRQAPADVTATLPDVAEARGVRSREQWPAARQRLLAEWQEIIGPFPERVPLDVQVMATETLPDKTRRLHVRYRADPVYDAEAYLLLPPGASADDRRPGAVVLHQTSDTHMRDPVGLDGREAMHIAVHLAKRGYVCIAPRNFLWGLNGKTYQAATDELLRQAPWTTGMAKMTWDAIRAADVLAARPEVDPDRLCSIGHSLGGKEVLYHAAIDQRIKAAVSCEGGVGLSFSNWDADWYLGKQIKAERFTPDHHELIALIAPRALLLIGGESADGTQKRPYVAANLPLWRMLGAEERIGLMRHKHGHDFPPLGEEREAVYRWVDEQLGWKR